MAENSFKKSIANLIRMVVSAETYIYNPDSLFFTSVLGCSLALSHKLHKKRKNTVISQWCWSVKMRLKNCADDAQKQVGAAYHLWRAPEFVGTNSDLPTV